MLVVEDASCRWCFWCCRERHGSAAAWRLRVWSFQLTIPCIPPLLLCFAWLVDRVARRWRWMRPRPNRHSSPLWTTTAFRWSDAGAAASDERLNVWPAVCPASLLRCLCSFASLLAFACCCSVCLPINSFSCRATLRGLLDRLAGLAAGRRGEGRCLFVAPTRHPLQQLAQRLCCWQDSPMHLQSGRWGDCCWSGTTTKHLRHGLGVTCRQPHQMTVPKRHQT